MLTAFGAPAAAPQPGLFGAGFGQPATNTFGSGGLFGAKPSVPAGGLFGAPAAAPLGGGGLFGQTQAQPQPSLFGGLGNTFGAGASTLGQQQLQQPPRQQLYASVDENAYGSNPLFANMGIPAPAAPALDKKKQPSLSNAFRSTPRSSTKITRLRGFGNSSASPGIGSPSSGMMGTPGSGSRGSPLHVLNGNGEDGGFMARPSVKKLVIEQRRPNGEDMSKSRFGRLDESLASKGKAPEGPLSSALTNGTRAKVSFTQLDPIASTSRATETDLFGSSTPVKKSAAPVVMEEKATTTEKPRRPTPVAKPVHGDYYTLPALSTLLKLPASALQALPDLVVGRVGFGQVSFNSPVDLTTLNSVEDLLGNIVVIEDRNCTVYPTDYEDKPPLGQGLNVPATITLLRCFPLDKATREPIKNKDSPKLISHIKRLRNLDGTEFIDFNVESGSWVFGVSGF